jgi:hypothetical protein
MDHFIELVPQNLQGCFSRDRQPILTVSSGDTISCQTLDARLHEHDIARKPLPRFLVTIGPILAERLHAGKEMGNCGKPCQTAIA